MDKVLTHSTGTPDDRMKFFKKLAAQAKKYRVHSLDPDLQAIVILNICAELQLKQFSASLEELQNVLALFGDYTPVPSETQLSAAFATARVTTAWPQAKRVRITSALVR